MSKPTTFRNVFDKALDSIGEMGAHHRPDLVEDRIMALEAEWGEVAQRHALNHIRDITQVEEYYPDRYCLTVGGNHQGEARLHEKPREDGKPYFVTLFDDEPVWAASLAEVKDMVVTHYREKELAEIATA